MKSTPLRLASLTSLRTGILAAIGLTACGGSVSVSGTGGGTSTGSSSGGVECAGAVPIPAFDGAPSGFSQCPDGTIHRVQPVTCSVEIEVAACAGTEDYIGCVTDDECTDRPHGRCASTSYDDFGGVSTQCGCVYPCADDSECSAGQVCVCGGVVPGFNGSFCAGAQCAGSSSCASGECGLSMYENGCGTDVELACRGAADACRVDAQCADGTACVLDGPNASWACLGTTCAIGRPLLVDGEARVSEATPRADWLASGVAITAGDLSRAARARAADHWLQVAALEHASVASFARFTLELLAIGAPADLLAAAQRAARDEVEHARLAYAVAASYSGVERGPGPLDLTAVTLRADRRSMIAALIAEGAVGESLGVAEAIELCTLATDPALRRVLARVAADEQRHAELAFRTLAYLLCGADDETRRFASRCFEEAIAAASRDPEVPGAALPEHGVLGAAALGAVRRRALAEVVAPCAAALLAAPDRPAARAPTAALA